MSDFCILQDSWFFGGDKIVQKKAKSFEVILEYNNIIEIMKLQNITVKSDYIGDKQLWDGAQRCSGFA